MKEDYLWDKTGTDPEIEKLENALAVFRYRETAPPELPAKVLPFGEIKKKTPRRIVSFAFAAAAACLAFFIVSLVVWFQFSRSNIEVVNDLPKTSTTQKNIELPGKESGEKPEDAAPVKPDDSTVIKIQNPKQYTKTNLAKVRKTAPVTARPNKTIAQNTKVKKPSVRLTEEEQYAYRQLMLALSITSSKLKLVKDKVEGLEEQNAVLKNRR
jgi:hypothetical protein